MMYQNFPWFNITLTPPHGVSEENCYVMRAYKGTMSIPVEGAPEPVVVPFIMGAWKPNREELEALNNGYSIAVRFWGSEWPPVAIFCVNEDGKVIEEG